MIIVRLIGGLGNQMFQYAAGRRLAHVHGVPLKLDVEGFHAIFTRRTPRQYMLNVFAIQEDFASTQEIEQFKRTGVSWLPIPIRLLVAGIVPSAAPTHIREKHYHFDPEVLNLPDNVYLNGYWQSEKYFIEIEEIIRSEFVVKGEQDLQNKQIGQLIRDVEAVSIHVRRGDYVLNPAVKEHFGACSIDYYTKAIEWILAHTEHSHFFIFSDDPGWAKKNLNLKYPMTIIDHNGPEKAYEDMRLLSLCKHHIIANSSFSWWGAWLCRNPSKIVIAPRKWFNKSERNIEDLIPEKWIKI